MDDAIGWPEGRFEGVSDFQRLLRTALKSAAHHGCQELFWSDSDFSDWPLGERAVIDALNAWAQTGRRLRLLALDYHVVETRHARFVTWRKTWGHLIEARSARAGSQRAVPSALWTPVWSLNRLDVSRNIVLAHSDRAQGSRLIQELESCWSTATPAFAATTLGL